MKLGKDYLRTKDITNGDVVMFKDEGVWVESTKYTYPDGNPVQNFEILVLHNKQEQTLRLNGISRKNLAKVFGSETKDWVGKEAELLRKTALVAGEEKEIIVAIPKEE